jgi:hypothetical protein
MALVRPGRKVTLGDEVSIAAEGQSSTAARLGWPVQERVNASVNA